MNILICVKQVPDDYAQVRLDQASGTPDTAEIEIVNNAFDTYALELAARYCETHGGTVTVATVGPESAQSGLKNLLAVGANKAYLFTPNESVVDESGVAAYLSQVVKQCEQLNGEPFDLILCGKESTDEISSQVGAMLAETMGLPFVSSVVEVMPVEGGLRARQENEDSSTWYEMPLPAVFTIAKPDYDPRYPTIKNKMAARKAVIPTYSGLTAQPCRVVCTGYAEPPARQSGVLIQAADGAEAAAKAVAMMADAKVL